MGVFGAVLLILQCLDVDYTGNFQKEHQEALRVVS